MSNADEEYVDADAPISDDELAAAAVVLATVHEAPVDPALESRLRADARAYFDARKKPRAVTTTSGTEVVIDEDDRAPASNGKVRAHGRGWSSAVWIAAAACVGLGVFIARSRLERSPAASAPMSETVRGPSVVVRDDTIEVSSLPRCTEGSRYVLTTAPTDGAAPHRIAVFVDTPFRAPATGFTSTELVVIREGDAGEASVVARSRPSVQ